MGNAVCVKVWMDLGELLLKKGDCNGCQSAMKVAKKLDPSLADNQSTAARAA